MIWASAEKVNFEYILRAKFIGLPLLFFGGEMQERAVATLGGATSLHQSHLHPDYLLDFLFCFGQLLALIQR